MPFLLLLILALACFADDWQPRWGWVDSAAKSALLTWAGAAVVVGLAALNSQWVRRRLLRDPNCREAVLARYGKWRTYHLFGLLAVYTLSLGVFGWGWAVHNPQGWGLSAIPGVELLVLAPFLAALILSWLCFYDAERALHRADAPDRATPFWGRWTYVGFHLRQNLVLVFVPLTLLLIQKSVGRVFPDLGDDWQRGVTIGGFVLALSVFVVFPWILRLILGLKPLPPGPLRDRLLDASRRLNFRCNDILLWNTRGHVANAMVAGVLPWLRYVLLTDRLTTDLTPDEVEAVFGHEVGHVKHHHMPLYLGFLLASVTVLGWAASFFFSYFDLTLDQGLEAVSHVAVVVVYILVVFGFLSRRCERQADIYGCRAVSCAEPDCRGHASSAVHAPNGKGLCPTGICTFIAALEKVARLNGISRDKPGWLQSWQHSTIARRVEFLQRVLIDPSEEPRFQRTVGLVKWAIMALVLGGLLVCVGVSLAGG
jgi:Zn-dependent protease with chaperone function